MKKCIISLQVSSPTPSGQVGYAKLDRLESSLKKIKFSGDFLAWRGHYPPGSPLHVNTPFGFKTFCFREAQKAGYEMALWLDSSAVAIRPLEPLFEIIQNQGYAMFKNHDYIWGEWCSDEVLERVGISREESFTIPEANAAALGLNFSHPTSLKFIQQWHEWASEGFVFRGTKATIGSAEEYDAIKWNTDHKISTHPRVKGHRHDQTAAGILAHQLGMTLSTEGVTDLPAEAYANSKNAVLIERLPDLSLSKILERVFWIERRRYFKSRVVKLLKRFYAA